MCNKQKYDKKSALTVLNECKKNKAKKYRNECRIYECPICIQNKEKDIWHLTSEIEHNEKEYIPLEDLELRDEWIKLIETKKG